MIIKDNHIEMNGGGCLQEEVNQYTGALDPVMRVFGFVLGEQMPEVLKSSETESGKWASQAFGAIAAIVPEWQGLSLVIAGRDLSGQVVKISIHTMDFYSDVDSGKYNLIEMDSKNSELNKEWIVDVGMSAADFALKYDVLAKGIQSLDLSLNTQKFIGLTGVMDKGLDVGAKALQNRLRNVFLDIPKLYMSYDSMLENIESGKTNGLWDVGSLLLKSAGILIGITSDYKTLSNISTNNPDALYNDFANGVFADTEDLDLSKYNDASKIYSDSVVNSVGKSVSSISKVYSITKDGVMSHSMLK